MNIQPTDVWTAAGVLLGFQATAFSFRVQREVPIGDKDAITWLPPADMLNLCSMLVLVIGVFVLPILGVGQNFIKYSFGFAVLLFVGYPFALAGHYDMYNNKTSRTLRRRDASNPETEDFVYCPPQERVVVTIVIIAAAAYVIVAIRQAIIQG